MASAEDRGRAARRSPPPAALPNFNDVDGIGGMDSNDDLIDALVGEAGEFSEQAIIDTGLPEDWDPSGGLQDFGGGHIASVTPLAGGAQTSAERPVRDGVVPRFGLRTPIAVAPRIAPQTAADEEQEESEEGERGAELYPEVEKVATPPPPQLEAQAPKVDLVEPQEADNAPVRPASSGAEEMDPDLLAALSEGVRGSTRLSEERHSTVPPLPKGGTNPELRNPDQRIVMTEARDVFSPTLRKRVLILDPRAPNIGQLRWGQLADRLIPQSVSSSRNEKAPIEYRDIPVALFAALFTALADEYGAEIAFACLREVENCQTLVISRDRFDRVVVSLLESTEKNQETLKQRLDEANDLMVELHITLASSP